MLEDAANRLVDTVLEKEDENRFILSANDAELLLIFSITAFIVATIEAELLETALVI